MRRLPVGFYRRCERLIGPGKIGNVLKRCSADGVGELSGLGTVTPEQNDPGVEVVAWQRRLGKTVVAKCVGRYAVGAGDAALGEIRRTAGIEKDRGAVDLINAQDAVEIDFDRSAERAPYRNAELVAPHVGKAGLCQLLGEPPSLLAVFAIAIDHERRRLVPANQPFDCRDEFLDWRALWRRRAARPGDVAGRIFRALARVEQNCAAVG